MVASAASRPNLVRRPETRKSAVATSHSRPTLRPRPAVIVASETQVSAGVVTGRPWTIAADPCGELRLQPTTPRRRTATVPSVRTCNSSGIPGGRGIPHSRAAVAWLSRASGGRATRSDQHRSTKSSPLRPPAPATRTPQCGRSNPRRRMTASDSPASRPCARENGTPSIHGGSATMDRRCPPRRSAAARAGLSGNAAAGPHPVEKPRRRAEVPRKRTIDRAVLGWTVIRALSPGTGGRGRDGGRGAGRAGAGRDRRAWDRRVRGGAGGRGTRPGGVGPAGAGRDGLARGGTGGRGAGRAGVGPAGAGRAGAGRDGLARAGRAGVGPAGAGRGRRARDETGGRGTGGRGTGPAGAGPAGAGRDGRARDAGRARRGTGVSRRRRGACGANRRARRRAAPSRRSCRCGRPGARPCAPRAARSRAG